MTTVLTQLTLTIIPCYRTNSTVRNPVGFISLGISGRPSHLEISGRPSQPLPEHTPQIRTRRAIHQAWRGNLLRLSGVGIDTVRGGDYGTTTASFQHPRWLWSPPRVCVDGVGFSLVARLPDRHRSNSVSCLARRTPGTIHSVLSCSIAWVRGADSNECATTANARPAAI